MEENLPESWSFQGDFTLRMISQNQREMNRIGWPEPIASAYDIMGA
jgi:hypothetical protein